MREGSPFFDDGQPVILLTPDLEKAFAYGQGLHTNRKLKDFYCGGKEHYFSRQTAGRQEFTLTQYSFLHVYAASGPVKFFEDYTFDGPVKNTQGIIPEASMLSPGDELDITLPEANLLEIKPITRVGLYLLAFEDQTRSYAVSNPLNAEQLAMLTSLRTYRKEDLSSHRRAAPVFHCGV